MISKLYTIISNKLWDRSLYFGHRYNKWVLASQQNALGPCKYARFRAKQTYIANIYQLVQNFAGRIVLGLRKYDRISEGLKSLKWLPIADKLFLNDSVMVHKCLIGRAPDYLSQKFTRRLDLHDRNTRNKKDLNLPRCRLTTGQRSFAYRGAACWNSLPKDLKEVADVGIFKKRLVNILLAWILFCFCIILII